MNRDEEPLRRLAARYPELEPCLPGIALAVERIAESYRNRGKLLICGNGGSAADSEHIVGELMKGFMSKRRLSEPERRAFIDAFPVDGAYLADRLQGALPAIALTGSSALGSACANDVAADMVYAQQVFGYGQPGDVLLAISTSGNSRNVVRALQTAKVKQMIAIGLTGRSGGLMADICDIVIKVPYDMTPDIQERHLPIYHTICVMLENEFFCQHMPS